MLIPPGAPFAPGGALFGCTSFTQSSMDTESPAVAQQLANLAALAERVATPGFKKGFREMVRAKARAANSCVVYLDGQGRMVREWPATGRVEIVEGR